MTFWGLWFVLMGSAFLWGRVEELHAMFRAGYVPRGWSPKRFGLALGIIQGGLTLIVFVLIGLGFFLFGWTVGFGLMVLALWVGSWQ